MATTVTLKPNAIDISGSTSGTTTLQASAVAGATTLTLPSANDTLVGKATTDTLTNKTLTTPSISSPTISDGTANGVAYLNGSKVLTTGSALVFDGTNLGVGVTPSAWGSSYKSLDIVSNGGSFGASSYAPFVSCNAYHNGTNWIYKGGTYGASVYSQFNGAHSWNIAASGTAGNTITFTQAMTLDASGNLGVGTTSPTYKITVKGGNANNLLVDNDGSQYTQLLMQRNSTANTGGDLLVDGTNGLMSLRMLAVGSLRFCTSASAGDGTERARIDSSGNLLVGASITSSINGTFCPIQGQNNTANQVAYFRNTNANPYGIIVNYSAASPNNTGNEFVYCSDSTTQRFSARSNGGLANYSANNVNLSDRREKTNFAPAKSYLDVICAIPVQTFNYIDQNLEEDDGLTLGVVAQDVQAVAPELVMESNWAGKDEEPKMRLSIYQTDLQYALMKCIQEQQALIQTLTDRITALENK